MFGPANVSFITVADFRRRAAHFFRVWNQEKCVLQFELSKNEQAVAEFKQYIKKGIGAEYPTETLQAGLILGSERFVERYQGLIKAKIEFLEIPRPQRYVTHKNIDEIFYEGARKGTNRDELIYQSYVRHGYTMKEIADYLKVHHASVSRSIKRYENRRKK